METFIPSIPAPAAPGVPSAAPGSASAPQDADGSSPGAFQLLMDSCLAQASGNGAAAAEAPPAGEPAAGDTEAGSVEEGGIALPMGAILAGLQAAAAQSAAVAQSAASAAADGAVSPDTPQDSASHGAEVAVLPAAGNAAEAAGGSAAWNMLASLEAAAGSGVPAAMPASGTQASTQPSTQTAGSSVGPFEEITADLPAAPLSTASDEEDSSARPAGSAASVLPDALPAPEASASKRAAGPDVPDSPAAKEISAAKPERATVEAQGEPGRSRPIRTTADQGEPGATAAATDSVPVAASEERNVSKGSEAGAAPAPDPASPTVSPAAGHARPAPETAHPARPAAAAPAAPLQKSFEVGENAFVLTRRSDTSVEVTLSPPGVGKLEIEVVLDKGVINANITAADPAGREAIERSLPQIVQTLANEGMSVGGFTVSLKGGGNQEGNAKQAGGASKKEAGRADAPAAVRSASERTGLVDIFV